jgi:hypothetical protein
LPYAAAAATPRHFKPALGLFLAAAFKRTLGPLGGAEQITSNGVQLSIPSWRGIRLSGGKACPVSGFARKGITTLDTDVKQARDRAEAAFKKKEQQLREGQQVMAEYQAALAATREKTARLRALRLARDAALKARIPTAQKQPA